MSEYEYAVQPEIWWRMHTHEGDIDVIRKSIAEELRSERDELAAELAALKAAQSQQWEPVPDGEYMLEEPKESIGFLGSFLRLSRGEIHLTDDYQSTEAFIPDDWCIMRTVEPKEEQA